MVSGKSKDRSAEPAFVEQPASARALAIPEILENVLKQLRPCRWKHVASVSKLWQGTVDALALSFEPNRTVLYQGIKVRFPYCQHIGQPWTSCNNHSILGALKRNPGYCRKVTHLHIGDKTPSDDFVNIMRTFSNLQHLQMCLGTGPLIQLAASHVHTTFTFCHLTRVSILYRIGMPRSVSAFLGSLPALASLAVYWDNDYRLLDAETEAEGLFASMPTVQHLEIRGKYANRDAPRMSAKSLVQGVRTLKMEVAYDRGKTFLAELVDVRVLPNLCTLPLIQERSSYYPQVPSILLETWSRRTGLRCPTYDQHLLRYWAGLTDEEPKWSDYSEEPNPFTSDNSW